MLPRCGMDGLGCHTVVNTMDRSQIAKNAGLITFFRAITAVCTVQRWIWRYEMGKHAIGGMRSMMVANGRADMRFRKKAYQRNKNAVERGNKNDQRRSNSDP